MAKYIFIVKLSIVLLVVCTTNHRANEAEMDQVEFLWKEQNWKGMPWFTKVHYRTGFLEKNNLSAVKDNYERVDKLKIIPLLMGCGYGKKLIDFLWLTTYAVTDLLGYISQSYVDAWKELERFLKKGAYAIHKLLLAFKQITSLDPTLNVKDIPFHDPMLAIEHFLNEMPSVQNGLTKSVAKWFNVNLTNYANSLGYILDINCAPKHSVIKEEKLTIAYENLTLAYKTQMSINFLGDFYLYKLDSAIEFITEELIYIGYNYLPEKKQMTYSVPPSSAAAYE